MRHQEPDIRYRIARVVGAVTAVGAAVAVILLTAGSAASAASDEVTGTTSTATAAAGPALQLFGLPLAAALWLLAGVVAATAGLVSASRRPHRAPSVPAAVTVAPADGVRT